jgi:outer membrane protein assembly factor BamB
LFNPIWQNDANLTGGYNVPSADLLYTHDSLIVTKYQGEVIAVNPEDGAATSLIQLGETIEGLTPAVAGDTLYIAAGSGRVTAYNLSQRGVQWQTKVSGQLLFGPATDGARVYAQSTANQDNVVALDAATGQTAWTQTISGSAGAPVIAEGKLFVAGDAVHALDPETGGELWKSETFLSVGGLAVYNGVVYAGGVGNDDVTFLALDAETGHVMWQRREQALFFKNRPAYDAGSKAIFIGAKDGGLYAFDAASGERRWRFQADNAIQSNVQVLDGVVYFTTFSGATYAVEAGMGILRSNFKPGTPVNTTGAPVILPGRAFVVNGATVYGLIVEK